MGGSGVVSDAVVAQLRGHAPDVQRVAGADRYATAVALSAATYAANSVSHVYVATGKSFPDGLSVGPVAGWWKAPLLLVPGNGLPAEVAAELRRLDPTNVVIVGGSGVVTDGVRDAIRALWP
jgi:putative cell wall-binding protein